MAKKHGFFGTVLKLGALATAAGVIYYKRNEIMALLDGVVDSFTAKPDKAPAEETEPLCCEGEIVIDETGKAAEAPEETPEDCCEC